MAKKKTIEEILAGVPPTPDSFLPDDMTGLNRGYEPQVPAPSREMQLEGILNRDPQQRANERYDEYMGKGAGKVGKKALDVFLAALSGFGTKGNQYHGKKQAFLDEERETFKQRAPLAQQELNTLRTTQQRDEASQRTAETARDKNWQAFILGAEKNGIAKQTLALNREKYETMIPLYGAQAVLTMAKADQQKVETEFAQKNQRLMGTDPAASLHASDVATNKNVLDGEALKVMIRASFGGGTGGGASTTTRETRRQVKDPITGIVSWEQGEPLTSTTQRSGSGTANPFVQQMLQNRVLQHPMFSGTGSFASTPAGPGPAPKPTATAPAPVSGRPTSGAGIAGSVPRFWEKPIPRGTMDRATQERHQGKQKTFASLDRVTSIFNNALKTSGISDLGTGPINSMNKVLLARRIFRDIKPMEAQLRTDLSSIQAKELLEFTGKQANERDRILIENMVPTGKESDVELLTKTVFFRLAAEYERLMSGDVIQNRPSMKPELWKNFNSGILTAQTKKLVDRFMAGKPLSDADFNLKRLYAPEATKAGIPVAEWLK